MAEMEGKNKKYDIEDRLINFSVSIINIVEKLPNTRTGNHIANQLVRCGTSPALNYGEAQSAESRQDFIHKIKICLKELRETKIWLKVIQRKNLIKNNEEVETLLRERDELISIFVVSIKTAEKNKRSKET
ncbi:MAG: four helix bundle protein [Planctomycetota bacterium]|nr:four helix bundle protein [Planctomycetota bacterium]